jgi:hypothetical protein
MLNLQLDPETESYLAEILQQENLAPEELIKGLIYQRWLRLQLGKTVAERLGGHPQYLLQGVSPDLSAREHRKRAIADHLHQHYPQPSP